MRDTTVITLDEYLVAQYRNGGMVTPFVIKYCDAVTKSIFDVCRKTMLSSCQVELGTVAYGEYLDRVGNGSICKDFPFSQFYRYGELPDRYALKLIANILSSLPEGFMNVRHRWLLGVIGRVLRSMR